MGQVAKETSREFGKTETFSKRAYKAVREPLHHLRWNRNRCALRPTRRQKYRRCTLRETGVAVDAWLHLLCRLLRTEELFAVAQRRRISECLLRTTQAGRAPGDVRARAEVSCRKTIRRISDNAVGVRRR